MEEIKLPPKTLCLISLASSAAHCAHYSYRPGLAVNVTHNTAFYGSNYKTHGMMTVACNCFPYKDYSLRANLASHDCDEESLQLLPMH